METGRMLLAEAIGTFFLCFAGIAAILSTQAPLDSGVGIVGVALAHGLALSVAVHAFGGISGAHVNPAMTIGFFATGRIKAPLAALYIACQLIGATAAAFACQTIFPPEAVDAVKLGIPLPPAGPDGDWVTPAVLFRTEFILTFLLMTAIFATAVDPRGKAVNIGAFAIGLTVTFDILAGGAVTGASMNPARSFGPALVYGDFHLHLHYWVATVLGAVVAALVYHYVLMDDQSE